MAGHSDVDGDDGRPSLARLSGYSAGAGRGIYDGLSEERRQRADGLA